MILSRFRFDSSNYLVSDLRTFLVKRIQTSSTPSNYEQREDDDEADEAFLLQCRCVKARLRKVRDPHCLTSTITAQGEVSWTDEHLTKWRLWDPWVR